MSAPTFTSIEQPNVIALNKLLSNWHVIKLGLTEEQLKPIKGPGGKSYDIHDQLIKYQKALKKGKVKVTYNYSKTHLPTFPGRQFAKGGVSMQSMKRWMRHLLANDSYYDLDIKNCHPNILSQLCKKKGWETPVLDNYLVNREDLLKEMVGLSRDDAKEVVLSIMNYTETSGYNKLQNRPTWLFNFKKEIENIQINLLEDPEYTTLFENLKKHKDFNRMGSLMNNLLCNIENKCLMKAIQYQESKDPVLAFDGFQHLINQLLKDFSLMSEYIFKETGYQTEWIIKPMNEGIDLSMYPEGNDEPDEMGDFTAATKFLEWCTTKKIKLVSIGKNNTVWYNPDSGLWSDDLKTIKPFIAKCDTIDYQHKEKDHHQTMLLNQLIHLIPQDPDWYLNRKSVGYLPIKNGVWDFANKTIVDYAPEFGYFYKLKVDYDEKLDTKEVQERLFDNLFKPGEVDYLKTCIARALAGHVDKLLFFFLGDGNSGKGLFETPLKLLLGQLFGIINGGSLTSKCSNGDSGKLLSWLIKIKDCKIAYCQEIDMDKPLNGVVCKKISSGGDGCQARTNGKDEIDFVLQPLCILAGNDIPAIQPVEDAFLNRCAYFEMPNVYLDVDAMKTYKGDKHVILIDTSIKDVWAKEQSTVNALFKLLVDSYSTTKPAKPESVNQATKEWTESDDVYEKIKSLFVPVEDEKSFISSKAFQTAVNQNNIHISPNKLGRIMTKLGHVSETKNVNGINTKIYPKIRFSHSCDY